MASPAWWRQVHRHFGISAPRMTVRTHLSWPWRVAVGLSLLGVVGGMWWWGFDFGQLLGGFNRTEIAARMTALETEARELRADNAQLRARNLGLASELAMSQGAQATLTRQVTEAQGENAQIKEELVFLQKLVADSNKQSGLQIQRLAAERGSGDQVNYQLLVVRGGNPNTSFDGHLTLTATVTPAVATGGTVRNVTVTVPEEQPETAAALKLEFKYYQRLEGVFRIPPGSQLRALTARAYEKGQVSPRASRSLNIP